MLKPVLSVAPVSYPVTLADVKANLRIDASDEDALLNGFIASATAYLDGYSGVLGRALINQTWVQKFPYFPGLGSVAGLALNPVQSISSITYYDENNDQQTLSTDVYALLDDELGSFVSLQYGQSWPSVYPREDAVSITYVAGYGADGDSVPAAIKQALLLLVGNWYENREATSGAYMAGAVATEIPFAVSALITPYRRIGF